MNKNIVLLIISIVIFVLAFVLLISGSDLLLFALLDDPYFPFGTLLTWLGMISFNYISIQLAGSINKSNSLQILISTLRFCFTVSLFWLLISFMLSGNFAMNFSGHERGQGGALASRIYWLMNYALLVYPLVVLLILLIAKPFLKTRV